MIEVRLATPEDTKALTDIMIRSWKAAFVGIMSDKLIQDCTNPDNCENLMRDILNAGKWTVYVGLLDGIPCGELIWSEPEAPMTEESEAGTKAGIEADTNTEKAEILALHSVQESWGTGLGKLLVDTALADIRIAGHQQVCLWAFQENKRARRFYEKQGFVHNGEERVSDFDKAVEVKYTYSFGEEA